MNRLLIFFCAVSLALCSASCSTGFNREWNKASASSATTSPRNIEGAWAGTWLSEVNGHHGELRAVVTPAPSKPGEHCYYCRYHATYAKILSGSYTTLHRVDSKGNLSGSQNLGGLLGGVYKYAGKVTSSEFHATYTSSADHGVFEMKRP